MPRTLPSPPSMRFLHEEAKDLLKAHKLGDAAVCPTLRLLGGFKNAADADILEADVALHDVQFALALDYGFESWPKLKAHVEAAMAGNAAGSNAGQGAPKPVGDPNVRLVLEGVPKIGYNIRLCPFPGSVEALLKYIGEPVAYEYIMGVTGAPFRRVWNRDDGGNIDLMYFGIEPHRRLFEALGFDYRVVPRSDRAAMLDAVKTSIAAGVPVIAFGIIGPPEAGLVAGYGEGGDVLLGHSYFDFASYGTSRYYEQRNWFEEMERNSIGMIVLGERRPRPEPRDVLISSLEWAIDLARTAERPNLPDHVCGLAAYEGWARGLEVDADYPRDNAEVSRTRAMVYSDQADMLCERAQAAAYLRSMTDVAADTADDLHAAAELYLEASNTFRAWPWSSHDFGSDEVRQGLCGGAFRRDIAQHIRQVAQIEARAVEHLEKALTVLRSQ
jgi:hypothetical protein